MKTITYIWRNVTRNKLRTMLTILSVGFCMALMTVLYGYIAMQDLWSVEAAKYNRIVVMNTQGFSGLLPIAHVDRVRATASVKAAVPYSWYGGNYGEEQMPFAQFGTDPKEVFKVWEEFKIDPDQLKAFQDERQGCVADRRLAERKKWQIGERIRLKGTFYPFDLDLKLVGLFDAPQYTDSLWFNWYYLDEGLRQLSNEGTGNAGTIFAKTVDGASLADVSKAIDDRFASSENPTRTQTESAFAQMFADMLGNIRLFILIIGAAVVFSLCLVTATAMAMSMRERTTEIAVLKAIGFSKQRVLWMVLGESLWIAILGGILGVALGCLFLEGLHALSSQFFPISMAELAGPWLLLILTIAGAIGLVSGIVPAVRASQLSVIDGLRRVV